MSTPLKKPIVISFDSIERAVLWAAQSYTSAKHSAEASGLPESRLRGFQVSLDPSRSIGHELENQLRDQGIDWRTWEPVKVIRVAGYTVEFKKGHVSIGCKSMTNQVVRDILNRLLGKNGRPATIKTYNCPHLTAAVLSVAKNHGHFYEYGSNQVAWFHIGCRENKAEIDSGGSLYTYQHKNPLYLDARNNFSAVVDYFKNNQSTPDIKVMGESVRFGSSHIQLDGYRVELSQVQEIANRLID